MAAEGNLQVIIPLPASCPQTEIMAHSPNLYRSAAVAKMRLKFQNCLSPPSSEMTPSISWISSLMTGELMSPVWLWNLAKMATARSRCPRAYSQRGDSAMKRTKTQLTMAKVHWR